jgi:ketosteroid isomerase-like protein
MKSVFESPAASVGGVCLAALLAVSQVRAQEGAAAEEVRAAAAAYLAALGRGHAAEILEFWTEDGVYIDAQGNGRPARQLVSEEFATASPAREAGAPTAIPTSIHLVGPAVAIEQSTVKAAPEGAAAPAPGGDFIAAWVKKNNRWQLSLLREFETPGVQRPTTAPETPLRELEWMVGRWSASQDQTTVELAVEWTPDKSYLVQRFTATLDGQAVRQGTQRIAWDPRAKQLRSWAFNADGSFSEATWRKEASVWVADSAGVLADGRAVKSVHFWTTEGDDACWFKSVRGEVDGEPTAELALKFARRGVESP